MKIDAFLLRAFAKSREEKAESLANAADLLRGSRRFDACAHAAYYSVYHAVLSRALYSGIADLRLDTRRYNHKEIPGFAQRCAGTVIVVTYGGGKQNYSAIQAVLELQGLRRAADYDPRVDDEQDAEKAYQLMSALRKILA